MTFTLASAKKKVLSSQKNFFFKTIQNLRCSGKLLNIVSVFSGNSLGDPWKAIHINFVNMVDKTQLPGVVYDWNQVSVLETETKVQFRYQSRNFFFPRPNFFLFQKLQIFQKLWTTTQLVNQRLCKLLARKSIRGYLILVMAFGFLQQSRSCHNKSKDDFSTYFHTDLLYGLVKTKVCNRMSCEQSKTSAGGPPLTRFSLPRIPLPQFLAYVLVSWGFSR